MMDLQHLARAVALGGLLMVLFTFLRPFDLNVPRSVPVISTALALIGMGAVRVLARNYVASGRKRPAGGVRKRTLIVGAGEAGTMLAREMLNNAAAGFVPVGFLDDDPVKTGRLLLGLRIYGPLSALAQVAQQLGAEEVVIAMPSVQGALVREVTSAGQGGPVALPHHAEPGRDLAGPGRPLATARRQCRGPAAPRPGTPRSGEYRQLRRGPHGAGDGRGRLDRLGDRAAGGPFSAPPDRAAGTRREQYLQHSAGTQDELARGADGGDHRGCARA